MEALKKEEDERDADEERFRRDSDRFRKEIEELEAVSLPQVLRISFFPAFD